MYAYQIANKKIVSVHINPEVVPEGWVTSEESIDPFKYEYIDGEFISKLSITSNSNEPTKADDLVIESEDDIIRKIIPYRNLLLRNSDWTQLPDAPISSEVKEAMKEWRQQLRDFTKNARRLGYKLPVSPMA